jgi:DNA-binding response OmpR family regulator
MAEKLGNMELDRERYELHVEGRRVDLTFTEFQLLEKLFAVAGRVVSHKDLVAAGWGEDATVNTSRLRVQMSRLRKKLQGSNPWGIRTVQRRGYALARPDA